MKKSLNIPDIVLEEIIRKKLSEQFKPLDVKIGPEMTATDLAKKGYTAVPQSPAQKEKEQAAMHTAAAIASIVTAFIPVVGPLVSAGIMMADAAQYAKEGDTYNAGLSGIFGVLPLIGPVAKLGGGSIAKLGKSGMTKLGSKVAAAAKSRTPLKVTATEQAALNAIQKNSKLVKQQADSYLAGLVKQNASKIKTMNAAAREALKQTAKKRSTRVAAEVLGVMGTVYAYDWAYVKANAITSAEVKSIFDKEKGRILSHFLKSQPNVQENSISDKDITTEAFPGGGGSNNTSSSDTDSWFSLSLPDLTSAAINVAIVIGAVIGGKLVLKYMNIAGLNKRLKAMSAARRAVRANPELGRGEQFTALYGSNFDKYSQLAEKLAKSDIDDLADIINKHESGKVGSVLTKSGANQLARVAGNDALKTIDWAIDKYDNGKLSANEIETILRNQIGDDLADQFSTLIKNRLEQQAPINTNKYRKRKGKRR